MNTSKSGLLRHYSLIGSVAILAVATAFFKPTTVVAAEDYIGSEACQDCHPKQYSDWHVSGHPYKLMKGSEAKFRPLPLPGGFAWDDISYVIGGYKWKSRYMGTDGYIITTTFDADGNPVEGHNQYNALLGTWSDYHAGEQRPYTCGTCHTTGWVADEDADTDNDLSDNQDGLPGIHGTFFAGGIQCEACHGPGTTMDVDKSAALCGTCHHRDDLDTIPAKDGFIRHHQQYQEFTSSPMSFMKCVDCHDPHKRAEFAMKKVCEDCHSSEAKNFAMDPMSKHDVECIDCHMPYASLSAKQLGPHQGDLRTHLFAINTDPDANLFTDDGKFVKLDADGKAGATLDFSCQRCHQDTSLEQLAKFAKNFHNDAGSSSVRRPLDTIGLNPGLAGTWRNADRDGEGFLMDVGTSNGVLTLVVSFYTYDTNGNQVFLIASGPATSGTTTDVDVVITEGPMWGADYDPNAVVRTAWGTGSFTFPSCTGGSMSLQPNQAMQDQGFTDLSYDLTRDVMETNIQCPSLVEEDQL